MAKMTGDKRKVTFTLPTHLIAEIKALVDQGQAPSQSAFVAEAIAWKVQQARRQQLCEEFRAAAGRSALSARPGRDHAGLPLCRRRDRSDDP
jgi:Arc/MetJ-type ribon-helix-helix transcriptional regulator